MKRAIFVGAGTAIGVAGVLAYHPGALFAAGSAAGTTSSAEASPASSTFSGDSVETGWGPVQVEITVTGSAISNVTALVVPDHDQHSAQISSYAIPQLEQQAMAAQSAKIDGVSGASYTSNGFAQSLQSALTKAGM